jgi:hypothetical protein
MRKFSFTFAAVFTGLLFTASFTFGQERELDDAVIAAPIAASVFQAAGPTITSIQGSVDQFRTALGAVNNGNAPGPLATGRREINWDGGGSTLTSPGGTPFDVFLNTRGGRFLTPGTGFLQAPASGLAEVFNIPAYSNIFTAFSAVRLFVPVGSNVTDSVFFVPGSAGNTAATTRGFGAVFTDIDLPDGSGPGTKRGNRKDSALIEYFAADGSLLYSSFAPASPGNGGLSFFGIVLDDARIARVRITAGNAALGVEDAGRTDVVALDDFIYGEPQPID